MKSAECGYEESFLSLGVMYYHGFGTEKVFGVIFIGF